MFDSDFLALPRPLADRGTPILINNACGSWHRLAETFTFCNAKAYIGHCSAFLPARPTTW